MGLFQFVDTAEYVVVFPKEREHLLMMAPKEFSRRRKFRTVRIGGFPNRQEFFVSLLGCFGVTLKWRSTSEPKD